MSGWHGSCPDTSCIRRCVRPGCAEPENHLLVQLRRVNNRWTAEHVLWDCTLPRITLDVAAAARQAIEELNPNMSPSDVAVARRVISRMLDKLEAAEKTTVTVVPPAPLLLTAHKRPHVVAAPRELTRAVTQHAAWLAQRKESA
jgi:hypothetical protein